MSTQKQKYITAKLQIAFTKRLKTEEKAAATVEKYGRDLRFFALWLGGRVVTQDAAAAYKRYLTQDRRREAAGVNSCLAALNAFFAFMQWEIRLKPLKIQRQTFKTTDKELSRAEYGRLLAAASGKGNERLHLILQTICSTGIRVSELCFITLEALRSGESAITNKGKSRRIFIPKKLKPLLLSYAKGRGIVSGSIFISKSGKNLNRSNIWAGMKRLCEAAKVAPSKVFPHNLRALFARLFYSVDKDIVRLADILGHSNLNTTRIYLRESGAEHSRRVDALGLVVMTAGLHNVDSVVASFQTRPDHTIQNYINK